MNTIDERLRDGADDLRVAVDSMEPSRFRAPSSVRVGLMRMAAVMVAVALVVGVPILLIGNQPGSTTDTGLAPATGVGETTTVTATVPVTADATTGFPRLSLNVAGWEATAAWEGVDETTGVIRTSLSYSEQREDASGGVAGLTVQTIGFEQTAADTFRSANPTSTEPITVHGQEGQLFTFGDWAHAVFWEETDTVEAALYVEGATRQVVLDLVESIATEPEGFWVERLAMTPPTGVTTTTMVPGYDPGPVIVENDGFVLAEPSGGWGADTVMVVVAADGTELTGVVDVSRSDLSVGFIMGTDFGLVAFGWAPAGTTEVHFTSGDGTVTVIDQLADRPGDDLVYFIEQLASTNARAVDEGDFELVAIDAAGEILATTTSVGGLETTTKGG